MDMNRAVAQGDYASPSARTSSAFCSLACRDPEHTHDSRAGDDATFLFGSSPSSAVGGSVAVIGGGSFAALLTAGRQAARSSARPYIRKSFVSGRVLAMLASIDAEGVLRRIARHTASATLQHSLISPRDGLPLADHRLVPQSPYTPRQPLIIGSIVITVALRGDCRSDVVAIMRIDVLKAARHPPRLH